jgi:hypothetical protein
VVAASCLRLVVLLGLLFHPEEGGHMFLRNVWFPQIIALQARIPITNSRSSNYNVYKTAIVLCSEPEDF